MLHSPLNHLARFQLRFRPGFDFSVYKYSGFFFFNSVNEMKLWILTYHELGAPVVQLDLTHLHLPLYPVQVLFFACLSYTDEWECFAV